MTSPTLPSILCFVAGISSVTLGLAARDDTPLTALSGMTTGLSRTVLDNGMVCLVKEDRAAPMVAIQIWVGTGSAQEGAWQGSGLSHLIEHMIFKGTPTRKPGDISRAIDDAGGTINAYTSLDRTVFWVDMPSTEWRTGLEVLADAVMNASFPEDEWHREKDVILREMAMCNDDPDRLLSSWLWQTTFRVHPYRHPVIGYADIFKMLTRDDLLAFFRRHYVPDNIMVSVVGDLNADEALQTIQERFSTFARRPYEPAALPQEPVPVDQRWIRKVAPCNLSRMEWAWHTVPLSHPDAPALDMISQIVGQGRSSRLVREIKEKQRLAHDISAWSYTPKEPGLFGLSVTYDQAQEPELIQAIDREIASWTQGSPFTVEDLEKARRQMLAQSISTLQTMNGQASEFASGEFYAGAPAFYLTYARRLETLTPDTLAAVAARYFKATNRTIATLNPPSTNKAVAEPAPVLILPKTQKRITSGGLTLLTREDHRLPLVHICVALNGGLLFENENNNGITSLMAELMTRGTPLRSAQDIAQFVESRGGSISPFSGHNSFGLQAQCLSQDAKRFMELMAECLLTPTFPEEEVTQQKRVRLAILAQQRESPQFMAQEALRRLLFPEHPYRWAPEGRPESVAALTPEAFKMFHAQTVVKGNTVLSVFGDVTPADAQEWTEKYFNRFPSGARPAIEHAITQPTLPKQTVLREPKEQTVLLAGFVGVTVKDPRVDALNVLQSALSGLSSDLLIDIRDKRGLAYYAGASQRPGLDPGSFVFYVGLEAKARSQVLDLLQKEMTRITTQGLRPEEFERARRELITRHKNSLQMNGVLAMECALNELYTLGYDYGFDVGKRLEKLTPEQVRMAAASIISTNRMAISIVMPESTSAP